MNLSIRLKSIVPICLLTVFIGVFIGFSNHSLNQIRDINHSLVQRFEEIAKVRQIESLLGNLIYPLFNWSNSNKPVHKTTFQNNYLLLQNEIKRLRSMEVVNPSELRLLKRIELDLEIIITHSSVLLALENTQHATEHHKAMEILETLSSQLESSRTFLNEWHEDEIRQVNVLQAQVLSLSNRIKYTGSGLALLTILAIFISIWINKLVLIQPILNIRDSVKSISAGNLSVKAPVSSQDEIGELAVCFNDMTDSLIQLYQQLDQIAHTDRLTGLLNRLAFEDISVHEISAAKRHGREFAIAVLDLDRFKNINDKYGHPVGDTVLVHVAQICKQTLRSSDYLFRYGGEEFILILKEGIEQGVLSAVERFRSAIETNPLKQDNMEIELTASIGVALFPTEGDNIQLLIEHADHALYEAKSMGRNRCIRYARQQ